MFHTLTIFPVKPTERKGEGNHEREREREGGREGEREGGREGGRERGREGGRERERERGKAKKGKEKEEMRCASKTIILLITQIVSTRH